MERGKRSSPKKAKPGKKTGRKNRPAKGEDKISQGRWGREGDFPIVGIGASAGGLKALEGFFRPMPPDSGMAFLVVQHLDPTHESIMDTLLAKCTRMKVLRAKNEMVIEPNHIYVNPPGKDLTVKNRTVHLADPEIRSIPRLPVDLFFRSLGEAHGEKAICIILSGTGTDGTLGLKEVKGAGGMVMVQDPKQAEYGGMPKSAIGTGVADFILPVEEMPRQLIQYVRHPFVSEGAESVEERFQKNFDRILMLIQRSTGHDFRAYKENTIRRRIGRRMALHQIDEISQYLFYLQEQPAEAEELFKDLLINVTNFFRDPQAFEVLKEKALTPLLAERDPYVPFRVWVPGCGTGEEAYSIAILLVEVMEELEKQAKVQIFATDIHGKSISAARAGIYPDNIAADVSPERLKRHFVRTDGSLKVDAKVREMTVFAVHDVTKDPPLSRLDLVSCRNLLIYLDANLQKRIVPMFHYVLEPGGVLFLGTAEGIGDYSDLFEPIDKKYRIFKRREADRQQYLQQWEGGVAPRTRPGAKEGGLPVGQGGEKNIRTLVEQAMIEHYSPVGVLINTRHDILYFHGETSRYLSPPTGEPSFNIFNLIRKDLYLKLNALVHEVKRTRNPASARGLQVSQNGDHLTLDLAVRPVRGKEDLMLVVFKEERPPEKAPSPQRDGKRKKGTETEGTEPRIAELEERLRITREELQATIEELETSNEELKSTNEELQANNEELQSINEELESSKEELQSTNEELETLNAELQNKNQELTRVKDDLQNLLSATDVGTIFLDKELRIQRFTPAAKSVFNLIEGDLGRSISHITSKLNYPYMVKDATEVLETLHIKQAEAETEDGRWISVRILPYRTVENVIEGVVLTLTDVTEFKKAEVTAQEARTYAECITETTRQPLVALDSELRVQKANRAFRETFKVSPEEVENRLVYELGEGQWNIPDLRALLEDIIPKNREFRDFRVSASFPQIGERVMLLNARQIEREGGRPGLILLGFEDVTQREKGKGQP